MRGGRTAPVGGLEAPPMARQCLHADGAGEGLERAAGSLIWGRLEALSSGEGEGWGRASFVVPAEPPRKRRAGAAETLFTARGLIVCQSKWLPESSSLKRKKRPDEMTGPLPFPPTGAASWARGSARKAKRSFRGAVPTAEAPRAREAAQGHPKATLGSFFE